MIKGGHRRLYEFSIQCILSDHRNQDQPTIKMLESFLSCLGCQRTVQKQSPSSTSIVETKYRDGDQPQAEIDAAAQDFVNVLIKAKTGDFNDVQLRKDLDNAVSTLSWSENLAAAILVCLETALRNGIKLGRTVEEATKKAMAAATEFATDHPVYFTLIALGVLALTVPWVLSWLGFAEIGIVEGKSNFLACRI